MADEKRHHLARKAGKGADTGLARLPVLALFTARAFPLWAEGMQFVCQDRKQGVLVINLEVSGKENCHLKPACNAFVRIQNERIAALSQINSVRSLTPRGEGCASNTPRGDCLQ
ncbi:MAG: hypothetical protein JSR83_11360 [Proteobacteria bacterium]|nr:hypothetical protein [Pseudomonadota bacterium]